MKSFAALAFIGATAGGALVASALTGLAQPSAAPASPPAEAVPAIGPADPGSSPGQAAERETAASTARDSRDHPMGLVRQRPAAGAAHQLRRYGRARDHDAQPQPGRSGHHHRADQETAHRFPGRGPHTLTGPIYVEGAEPGDVLKVTINKIVPRAYATNFNVPGMFGEFPKEYPDGQVKYLYLDWDKKVTEFLPGVQIPLRPFPGTIGVARKEPGRYSSVPPGEYAGNMDIRDLTEGAILYVPVLVPGALLWSGDSHAGQGNGEVNLTAIETAYKELNITVDVIKGKPLDFPRIETRNPGSPRPRPGSQQSVGSGQGADHQVALRASQGSAGAGGEADAHSFGLSRRRRWSTSRRAFTA